MTSDVDAGEIVATESFAVDADETAFSLNARCYEAALATFPRVAAALADGARPDRTAARRSAPMFHAPRPAGPGVRPGAAGRRRPCERFGPSISVTACATASAPCAGSSAPIVLVIDSAAVGLRPLRPAGRHGGRRRRRRSPHRHVRRRRADHRARAPPTGRTTTPAALAAEHGIAPGIVVPSPDAALVGTIADVEPTLSRHELFWLDRLAWQEPTALSTRCQRGRPRRLDRGPGPRSGRRPRRWSRCGCRGSAARAPCRSASPTRAPVRRSSERRRSHVRRSR